MVRRLNCAQVTIRNLVLRGSAACITSDSTVVFEQCSLFGDAADFLPGQPALDATNSDVQAVYTSMWGGRGRTGLPPIVTLPGSEAVALTSAALRVIGTREQRIEGGIDPLAGQLPGIRGNGTARVDPRVTIRGTPPVGPLVVLTRPTMPGLACDGAVLGGMLTVWRRGALGGLCVIAVGPRGASRFVPGIADPVWLDLASMADRSRRCRHRRAMGRAEGRAESAGAGRPAAGVAGRRPHRRGDRSQQSDGEPDPLRGARRGDGRPGCAPPCGRHPAARTRHGPSPMVGPSWDTADTKA